MAELLRHVALSRFWGAVRVIYATSGDAGEDVSGRKLKGAALGQERHPRRAATVQSFRRNKTAGLTAVSR